jgi:hypothetical protein
MKREDKGGEFGQCSSYTCITIEHLMFYSVEDGREEKE